jgi:ferrochelatase
MTTDAVLLVGHGTVTNLDDLPEFLKRIRRGIPAGPELLATVRAHYEAIGDSPLQRVTADQARALERQLGIPVLIAMRMWHPTIEEVLSSLRERPPRRLCVLPAAPFSVHIYATAVSDALRELRPGFAGGPPELFPVAPWGLEPAFIAAHAERIAAFIAAEAAGQPARSAAPANEAVAQPAIVATAHSLPESVIVAGDPYQRDFQQCVERLSQKLGRHCHIAFQSQGASGGKWLGPDVRTVLQGLKGRGVTEVLLAPVGFLTDHLETLYDLDIDAAAWAAELGLRFSRVPALNDHPGLIDAMVGVVQRALSSGAR